MTYFWCYWQTHKSGIKRIIYASVNIRILTFQSGEKRPSMNEQRESAILTECILCFYGLILEENKLHHMKLLVKFS